MTRGNRLLVSRHARPPITSQSSPTSRWALLEAQTSKTFSLKGGGDNRFPSRGFIVRVNSGLHNSDASRGSRLDRKSCVTHSGAGVYLRSHVAFETCSQSVTEYGGKVNAEFQ